jgi:hypothetical protein
MNRTNECILVKAHVYSIDVILLKASVVQRALCCVLAYIGSVMHEWLPMNTVFYIKAEHAVVIY